MRVINLITRYVFLVLLISSIISCANNQENKPTEESIGERYSTNWHNKDGDDIEIVKVRNCEYVFWHRGYGSDMEHYEGCENEKHFN